MKRTPPAFVAFVLGCSLVPFASADNLIVNPDFDDGLDGWTVSSTGAGQAVADETTGLPGAPSALLTGDALTQSVSLVSTCVEISDTDVFDFYVNLEVAAGLASVHVIAYSDNACATQLAVNDSNAFAPHQWQTYAMTNVPVPAGTHSANVMLTGSHDADGTAPQVNFDHVALGPTGTAIALIDLNQEGLTGTWYDPQTSGQGLQVQITPATSADVDGALFGAWFTYDVDAGTTPDTQRWYSLQGGIPLGATSADVVIYQNTGGSFDAGPSTSPVQVGTGTLRFETCERGTLDYAFDDGRAGSIPLQRVLVNVDCVDTPTPTDAPSDFGLSGAWYDPATGGQGMLVEINPGADAAFIGWYTYQPTGTGADPSGQRWFSAQAPWVLGSTTVDLTVFASTGGAFDSPDDTVTTTPVGTATLTYASCESATLDYAFTEGELAGIQGSIPLTRLGATPSSCTLSPPQ
ncbi:MAG TPA: hypothetical protein VJX31_03435 [Casimicrobiaceae bacterium]|nr:hypothetical protein [Casimicrobiaceae bacterium]